MKVARNCVRQKEFQNIKFMKRKIFMACATLIVSAAAVVGVKAYNHSQMSELALANIEALTRSESPLNHLCMKKYQLAAIFDDIYRVCDTCSLQNLLGGEDHKTC